VIELIARPRADNEAEPISSVTTKAKNDVVVLFKPLKETIRKLLGIFFQLVLVLMNLQVERMRLKSLKSNLTLKKVY